MRKRAKNFSTFWQKATFCVDCIQEILEATDAELVDAAVLYDAEETVFYPVAEGMLAIGDYTYETEYENGGYEIEIIYVNYSMSAM